MKVAPKPVAKVIPASGTKKPARNVTPDLFRGLPGGKSGGSGSGAERAARRTPEQVRGEGFSGTSAGTGASNSASASALFQKLLDLGVGSQKSTKRHTQPTHPQPLPSREGSRAPNTLDGSWDRKLARGLISPDCAIDLHGHNLSTAYATLDGALEQAIRMGDRVVLLVTGKPPRPESERPHARGAIRAAIGDWLAGSRHASAIAAVRGAHPRHGGAGALYIILRRGPARNS